MAENNPRRGDRYEQHYMHAQDRVAWIFVYSRIPPQEPRGFRRCEKFPHGAYLGGGRLVQTSEERMWVRDLRPLCVRMYACVCLRYEGEEAKDIAAQGGNRLQYASAYQDKPSPHCSVHAEQSSPPL